MYARTMMCIRYHDAASLNCINVRGTCMPGVAEVVNEKDAKPKKGAPPSKKPPPSPKGGRDTDKGKDKEGACVGEGAHWG